jgi:hypothetical protein
MSAHAAGKPPGTTNLFSEEDNQMFNQQYHAAIIQSGDHASGHLARPWLICQWVFSQKLYGQWLIPPLQLTPALCGSILRCSSSSERNRALIVVHHWHIVAINVCGAVNSYPHHPKLVTRTSCGFYTVLHCNKFSAKHTWLHSRISNGEPHNGLHIQIIRKSARRRVCALGRAWRSFRY